MLNLSKGNEISALFGTFQATCGNIIIISTESKLMLPYKTIELQIQKFLLSAIMLIGNSVESQASGGQWVGKVAYKIRRWLSNSFFYIKIVSKKKKEQVFPRHIMVTDSVFRVLPTGKWKHLCMLSITLMETNCIYYAF